MKYKIEKLEDITDSREILKSSPKGFSKIMTYIILALVVSLVLWSLLAHKEVSTAASGVVRPGSGISKVSSSIAGNISEINIKDGDEVREGDTLAIINGTQYEIQKNVLQKSIDDKNKNLQFTKTLKESILDGENKFSSDDKEQEEYSKKYELFKQNLNSTDSQAALYELQKNEINKDISNLELLKKGIEKGENYFSEGSYCYYQYKDYILSMKNYEDQIKTCENNINTPGVEQAAAVELKKDLQAYNAEKEKLKNTSIMSVVKQIEDSKSKLKQLQVSSAGGTYKEQYISNLDSTISTLQSTIDELNINLESVNTQLDSASIKAPSDGEINMISEVSVGDFIQIGGVIASVVPDNQEDFEVNVYINNQDFGNIKEGQDVMIELASLPSNEYGYIKSSLKSISADTKNSQNFSYYTAICPIEKSSLINKKGESAEIKNGMIVKARIVSRRVSYFKYFLEKMNILD